MKYAAGRCLVFDQAVGKYIYLCMFTLLKSIMKNNYFNITQVQYLVCLFMVIYLFFKCFRTVMELS